MYFFSRIKPPTAMKYLELSRDSFKSWCEAVNLKSFKYEFSNRTYFESGEFYAIADKSKIELIKQIHGDKWSEYYEHYLDVVAFLTDDEPKPIINKVYQPKSKDVDDFIQSLKK